MKYFDEISVEIQGVFGFPLDDITLIPPFDFKPSECIFFRVSHPSIVKKQFRKSQSYNFTFSISYTVF